MFPDNNWYGHRHILLKYLGIKDKEIFASLQHGWRSQFLDPIYKKKKINYPILFWTKKDEDYFKKRNNNNVYSIGAPFLYLCKILNEKNETDEINKDSKNGTIVFPTHSSQDFIQETDHNLLIHEVEQNFSGPYTVCFYYYDLNQKNISIYKDKNWRVVCCVRDKTDKDSLYRLYKEIKKHETVVTGEFSSSLFYGMYLKKKTRVLFNSNKRFQHYNSDEQKFVKLYEKEYPELLSNFLSPEKGLELGKKELGYDCLKDKHELNKILGCNSIVKSILSKFFSALYDMKYGSGLRKGKDLSKKDLEKYISSV